MTGSPLAITLDLDDTLWPVWPAIQRAEEAVHQWLLAQAPATAAAYDPAGLRRLRNEVAQGRADWGHDLSAIRIESLREALRRGGDDAALAEPAFEVFAAARNRVDLYPDAAQALQRLASRYPLVALTNGNADIGRVGVAHFFQGSVSARDVGVGKPAPEIFRHACRRLSLEPQQVLHIGDDLALDVQGALDAGLQAIWLCREPPAEAQRDVPADPRYRRFGDLLQVAAHLDC